MAYTGGNAGYVRRLGKIPGAGDSLSSGLRAYWKLEEASGDRVDSIGGLLASPSGTVAQGTGKLGNCLSDNALGELICSPAPNTNNFQSSGWSVSFWFQRGVSTPANARCLKWYNVTGSREIFQIYWSNTSHTFVDLLNSSTTSTYDFGVNLPTTDTWVHVVASIDAAFNPKVYVNSSLVHNPGPLASNYSDGNETRLTIGGSWGGGYWKGLVDEVGIWGRALTLTEVEQLYNSGAGRRPASVT